MGKQRGKPPHPFRQILCHMTARYLAVKPDGLVIAGSTRQSLDVQILATGGARTLYRGRRPQCRSLDGINSVQGKACADCPDRKGCTPQVRVDLFAEGRPCRLLLAYTSAKNYLLYIDRLRSQSLDVDSVRTRIEVLNRGSWGELRFGQVPADK